MHAKAPVTDSTSGVFTAILSLGTRHTDGGSSRFDAKPEMCSCFCSSELISCEYSMQGDERHG